jgi:hypothetical protein
MRTVLIVEEIERYKYVHSVECTCFVPWNCVDPQAPEDVD